MATISDQLAIDISDTFKKAQQDMTNQDNVLFGTGNVTITKPDGVTKVSVPAWTTMFNIANKSITTDNMSSMNPNFRNEIDVRYNQNNMIKMYATNDEGSSGGWVNNLTYYWHGGYGQIGLVRGASTDINKLLVRVKTLGGTDYDWNFLPNGTLNCPGTVTTQGQLLVHQNDEAIVCQSDTDTGPTYVRFKKSDGTNAGYVGKGGTGNSITFSNNISSNYINLHETGYIEYVAKSGNNHRFSNDVQIVSTTAGRLTTGYGTFGTQLTIKGISITTNGSDINLKDNVAPIENALDRVSKLKGVTFNWKDDGRTAAGVIAQETQKVLPELVHKLNDDKVYQVDYNGLTGYLIESVKELKSEIDSLKKELAELKGDK